MDLRKNLWTFKYQPETFNDIILNDEIKPKLSKAMKELPNMLLYGNAGVGKGCFANLLKKKENIDYMWLNGSDENGIDVFRNKVIPFATAMCMSELKVVIINEADALSGTGTSSAQKLLRQLMEDTYKLCRFILLCNYEGNIINELKSRCQCIKIDNPPKKEIGKLCLKILKQEKVQYDPKDVISIVSRCFPDVRKTINVLQENTIDGKLTGSRISLSEELFEKIFDLILKQDIESLRQELKSNYIQYEQLYEYMFERVGDFKNPGEVILQIGKYLYQEASICNSEINFVTMIVNMMYKKII
jgi:DNA polymerase III delta prime subunit